MTLRNVIHSFAPRSIAASSRWRSNPINLAFTVTTMKLMMNITWAMKIVQKPSGKTLVRFRKSVSNEAPRTISGVDIGQEDEQVRRATAPELVADDCDRDQRAEGGCDHGREQADIDRDQHGVAQAEHGVPLQPVVERESLPDVVEATGGLVEREEDHDRDRQHQVGDDEQRIGRERVPPDGGGHPVSLSVPTARTYTRRATRIAAISTNESEAAVG